MFIINSYVTIPDYFQTENCTLLFPHFLIFRQNIFFNRKSISITFCFFEITPIKVIKWTNTLQRLKTLLFVYSSEDSY